MLLDIRPNWASPITERLSWNTDVLKTRSGKEQRIMLRSAAKATLEYDFLVNGQQFASTTSELQSGQGSEWDIPLWHHTQKNQTYLAAGTSVVSLNSSESYGIFPGDRVILFSTNKVYEIATILSTSTNSITLTAPLSSSWSEGIDIIPLQKGRISDAVKFNSITRETARGVIQITLTDYKEKPYTTIKTLNGKIVLDVQPNRVSPLQIDYRRDVTALDYNLGPAMFYDLHGFSDTVQSLEFVDLKREGVSAIRALAEECKGMWKSFYMPSHSADIYLKTATLSSQSHLDIFNTGYTSGIFARFPSQYVRVYKSSGSFLDLLITGSSVVDSGTERVLLSAAIGEVLNPSDVSHISLLNLHRLESDTVEVVWTTEQTSSTTIPIRRVLQ